MMYPNPVYELLTVSVPETGNVLYDSMEPFPETLVSVDTETDRNGDLWCMSFSYRPGEAYVVMRQDLSTFAGMFHPPFTIVMHNAVFDLGVLAAAGIEVTAPVHDTMLMAHVLEEERLGLKFLARTLLGMSMEDYDSVVRPAQKSLAVDYLVQVVQYSDCPPAPPTEEMSWDKKNNSLKLHTRHPQPIGKKAARIIAATLNKGSEKGSLVGYQPPRVVDPFDRWKNIDAAEKAAVEEVLGPMPAASIEDVKDQGRWVRYSARDADATRRLYPVLKRRLEQ